MKTALVLFLSAFTAIAYPISSVRRTASNEYIGRYTNTDPKQAAAFPAGVKTQLVVETKGCAHVPGKDASAIIDGNTMTIWFSDGGNCAVTNVTTVNTKE